MEYAVIGIAAALTSALTLFSGFGLGTLLLPAFALFFPVDVAVALTAIVHFLNNLFKLALVGRRADLGIVGRFGVPALVASFAGAWLLVRLAASAPLASYTLFGRVFQVQPLGLVIGILMAFFALFEILPAFRHVRFGRRYLPLGGVLSGFFGGLSGHQGALRSAFLVRSGLTPQTFIASNVVIACMVDVARLTVYGGHFQQLGLNENGMLLATATACAFLGAFVGTRLMDKVTMAGVQGVVAVMLLLISLLLAAGLI